MQKLKVLIIGVLLLVIFCPQAAWPGSKTNNEFAYKPDLGARGTLEKEAFDQGLDRIDARLGNEVWVGDPKYGSSLLGAITAIGAAETILRVPRGTYNLTSNLTVPANVTLKLERGAMLAIDSGKVLILNGGLEAGSYRIFAGAGSVSLGSNIFAAKANWWYDGGDDWRPAIQSGINALTTGVVSVPGGTLSVGNTIQGKAQVELRLSRGTTLKPTGDFTVFDLVAGAVLSGGRIDVGDVVGYSSAAVRVYDVTTCARKTYIYDLELRGYGSAGSKTGTAILLKSTAAHWITGVFGDRIQINNFEKGIYLDSSSGGGVNANMFANIRLQSPIYGVYCDGGGNHFVNVDYQSDSDSQKAFYFSGGHNHLTGMVWDWAAWTTVPKYAVEFAPGANNNLLLCNIKGQYVKDSGLQNKCLGCSDPLSNLPLSAVIPPASYRYPSFTGSQDDILAFCNKSGAVITADKTPSAGNLNNVFDLIPNNDVEWTGASLPVTITIELPNSITPSFLGIKFFTDGLAPKDITWKVYSGAWYTVKELTNNASDFVWVQAMDFDDPTPRNSISKISITLNRTNAEDRIAISRIFAYSTTGPGTSFLQKGGDIVWGQLAANDGFLSNGPIKFSFVAPPAACSASLLEAAGNLGTGNYSYKVTFVTANGETDPGTISNMVTTDATHKQVQLANIPTGPYQITSRKLYRTLAGGTAYKLLTTINDNTSTTFTDNLADGSLGADAPWYNTTAGTFYSGANPILQFSGKGPGANDNLLLFKGGAASDSIGFFNGSLYKGGLGLGIGGAGMRLFASPLADKVRLDVSNGNALEVYYGKSRFTTATAGDDPYEDISLYRVTTTDATETALMTTALTDNNVYTIEATVTSRCSGGSGGNSGKGASFKIIGTFKRSGGGAIRIGSDTAIHTAKEVAEWEAHFDVSGNNVLINVTGAANDSLTWHATVKMSGLSS